MPAPTMPFGKYEGKPVAEVEESYVGWVLGNWEPRKKERHADVMRALTERLLDHLLTLGPSRDVLARRFPPPTARPVLVHQLGPTQLSPLQVNLFREMVRLGFRRLAAEIHPDVGGTTETMQALNDLKAIIDRTFEP